MNFDGMIDGLHHVTATVADAREDYDFYTGLLGLRLVKQTVNFDNENVYHFYYANHSAQPSAVFTTFPYKGQGIRKGTVGHGQVTETLFSAPEGSAEYWKKRIAGAGLKVTEEMRFGKPVNLFEDPSGLIIGIVEDPQDKRDQAEGVHGLRGVHHVVMAVKETKPAAAFLKAFGYRETASDKGLSLYEAGEGGAGNMLVLKDGSSMPAGLNGMGTVHHLAHRVRDISVSKAIKSTLEAAGFRVSEVRERKYFRSVYFRIPGGVLFEVATEGPGFTEDETLDDLGSSLMLPDWQEERRSEIESRLNPFR